MATTIDPLLFPATNVRGHSSRSVRPAISQRTFQRRRMAVGAVLVFGLASAFISTGAFASDPESAQQTAPRTVIAKNGDTLWDIADEPSRKHYIDAQRDMPGLVAPFPGSPSFLTRHPLLTLIEPVKMTGAEQAITRRTYIYATKDAPTVFTKFHERVKVDPDWKVYSLPTGHGVMVEKPEETAAILLEAAA